MTTTPKRDEYYIQNMNASYLGNSPAWWAKDGKGYTAYILNAHRFTKQEADALVKEDPAKWKAFNCAHVDARLHLIYDAQDNRRLGTDEPCGWEGGYAPHPRNASTSELVAALEKIKKYAQGDYPADQLKDIEQVATSALAAHGGK